MQLDALPAFDAQGLEPLLSTYPYNDYRHYRTLSKEVQARILVSEVERASEQGQLLALRGGDQVVGLATLSHLPWDSTFFGLPTLTDSNVPTGPAPVWTVSASGNSELMLTSPPWPARQAEYRRSRRR